MVVIAPMPGPSQAAQQTGTRARRSREEKVDSGAGILDDRAGIKMGDQKSRERLIHLVEKEVD